MIALHIDMRRYFNLMLDQYPRPKYNNYYTSVFGRTRINQSPPYRTRDVSERAAVARAQWLSDPGPLAGRRVGCHGGAAERRLPGVRARKRHRPVQGGGRPHHRRLPAQLPRALAEVSLRIDTRRLPSAIGLGRG